MSSPDQYGIEVALARAALGSPREAAESWRAGCFRDRMISDLGPAILAATWVWADGGRRWEEREKLVELACRAIYLAGVWDDDARDLNEGDWLSPFWGIRHVRTAVGAMRDVEIASSAWHASLSRWSSLFASEAA